MHEADEGLFGFVFEDDGFDGGVVVEAEFGRGLDGAAVEGEVVAARFVGDVRGVEGAQGVRHRDGGWFHGLFIEEVDAEFRKRAQDEVALRGAWMREGEFGRGKGLAGEVDEVDVDGARAVGDGANAAEAGFDFVHVAREGERIERGFEDDDLIEELLRGKFGRHIDGVGFDDGGGAAEMCVGQGRKCRGRTGQVVGARFDVGAKRDDGALRVRGRLSAFGLLQFVDDRAKGFKADERKDGCGDADGVETRGNGHTDASCDPDARGSCQAVDAVALDDDGACTEEADAAHNLCRDAGGVRLLAKAVA